MQPSKTPLSYRRSPFDISDIRGAQPSGKLKHITGRDYLNVNDIIGASSKIPKQVDPCLLIV